MIENSPGPSSEGMNLKAPEVSTAQQAPTPHKASLLERYAKAHTAFEINVKSIEGTLNFEKIPLNQPLIIASSHLSDIDTEAISSIVEASRPIGIAVQASHLNTLAFRIPTQWATDQRLFPVATQDASGRQALHQFRLSDYEKMTEAMKTRHLTMVIAAHRPSYNNQLAKHPGIGMIALASLTNALIVPSAVAIEGREEEQVKSISSSIRKFIGQRRPNARIAFGEPIQIDYLTKYELSLVNKLLNNDRNTLSEEERIAADAAYAKIKAQGDKVMEAIAKLLPEEKRGKWAKEETE